MAKAKKGPSEGAKAMAAAKKAMAEAKTDAAKAAAQKQIDAATALKKTEGVAKFKELASKRLTKALDAIAGLGKLANPRAYGFDADQVAKIKKHLTDEVSACVSRYERALTGGGGTAEKSRVTL